MANNSDKLRECPFCGSKETMLSLSVGMKWLAGCNRCGCRTGEYNYSLDASGAWNRRAADQEEAKHISAVMDEMMSRGWPDDDCDENHMSMPMPVEGTPF